MRASTTAAPSTKKRRARLWLLLVLLLGASLLLSLRAFLRALPAREIHVSLHRDGRLQRLTTTAETVGEMLDEYGMTLADGSLLSHPRSQSLHANFALRIIRPRVVSLQLGGQERELRTTLYQPLDILQEAGIRLGAQDQVWVNGALAAQESLPHWSVPAWDIRIRQPLALQIVVDGERQRITTAAATVGAALQAAGIELHPADIVQPAPDSAISASTRITITRAKPVELHVDGLRIASYSQAATVGELLQELNAQLFGLDRVEPPPDSALTAGMRVSIRRLREDIEAQREPIPYETRYQPDADLPLDEQSIRQAGREGQRELRSRVRYEDGVELSRELSETVLITAPEPRIIAYGTKIVALGTVATAEGPREYWRRLCVYTTSYNPRSNGGNLLTATGASLAKGIVAAKPDIIAYYTEVYVPDYGLGSIRDTGGGPSSTSYWIDLGYSDEDYRPWSSYNWVYLLMPPPRRVNYRLPTWSQTLSRPNRCG